MHGGEVVRLFGCSLLPAAGGEPVGSVLGFEAGSVIVAVSGGRLAVEKVRVGGGAKVVGEESGLSPGDALT